MNLLTHTNKSFIKCFFILIAMCLSTLTYAQCEDFTNPGNISGNQSLNGPGTPSQLNSVLPATGGAGTAEYLWMYSVVSSQGNTALWTTIPGATGANYQPGIIIETTNFRRCARRSGCNTYVNESNVITVTVSSALPVELVNFSGNTKGQNALLSWTTLSELNHDYFVVEHSTDGINFREVDVVNGNGNNSDTKKEYSITHYDAIFGVNFYRLRQVDLDGKVEYSEVIQLKINSDTNIQISPNPTIDLMTVNMSELPQNAAILTFHHAQSGQKIHSIEIEGGESNLQINTEYFASGIYILQVFAENGTRLGSSKFVKVRR